MPKEKAWEIWSEGYRTTGEVGGAIYHGSVNAKTFQRACDKKFTKQRTYNPLKLTLWGCRLFNNQLDAIRSFG